VGYYSTLTLKLLLAEQSVICKNVSVFLTFAGSKRHKGYEIPLNGPSCLSENLFFSGFKVQLREVSII